MIKHPTKLFQLGLNQVLRQSIVYWPKEKRAVFDKTSYNPNWVRSLGSQSFSTEIQSKKEEHSRLKNLKTFQFPTFKAGDVVKYANLDSTICTRFPKERETSSPGFAWASVERTHCTDPSRSS